MKLIHQQDIAADRGDTFTGVTYLQRMVTAQEPGGMAVSVVRFEDGSRTNWHTHPGEQVLFVLEGQGMAGNEAGEEFSFGPGDVIYAPPGEKHWHGAAPGQNMTHLSVTNRGAPEWFDAPGEGN
jgi:quercetin dioxygenase-like cupin family protein